MLRWISFLAFLKNTYLWWPMLGILELVMLALYFIFFFDDLFQTLFSSHKNEMVVVEICNQLFETKENL